eukprot:Phypoly_transcript_09913.p1 GENE.Phypoly_transcript_09913~~Phypoly_transcript_09913.p1  ORF type:complete len:398 (+),score=31.45 Phypoly_transcript_09913:75-1196(+)
MAGITHLGLVYYGKELKAIAEQSGIPLGKLVLMQLVYEACACCTSVVVPNADGVPLHIRTMDWEFPFLGPLTVEYHFVKNGERVYSATSWVGYVGILTGMSPGGYSVSVNFRNTGTSPLQNLKKAITRGWPIGFLLREVFESTKDYDQAVQWLSTSSLIAPCYFTVCGINTSKTIGTLITRKRGSEENRWTVLEHGPIVQTNIDHWSNKAEENILSSIQRRALARRLLNDVDTKNEATLWSIMSAPPIFNDITVYATFMCPQIGVLHTRVPQDSLGFVSRAFPQFVSPETLLEAVNPVAVVCSSCNSNFHKHSNLGGECMHTGEWHDTFGACGVKCAYNLTKSMSVGKCHWSCCYSLDHSGNTCISSGPHKVN